MYDVLTAREYTDRGGDKKTTFTKIGVAFDNKNGDGFTVNLNALPLADKDGEVRLICKKSKPRDGAMQDGLKAASEVPFDDTIPF